MALSIMAFAYGIAARWRKDVGADVEITRLKAENARLLDRLSRVDELIKAETSHLLDRLSVRLDELNDLKRQLAEAKIETRLAAPNYAQAASAHPWMNEIAECAGGGRARCFKGPGGA